MQSSKSESEFIGIPVRIRKRVLVPISYPDSVCYKCNEYALGQAVKRISNNITAALQSKTFPSRAKTTIVVYKRAFGKINKT
jgi:hypothetical protein